MNTVHGAVLRETNNVDTNCKRKHNVLELYINEIVDVPIFQQVAGVHVRCRCCFFLGDAVPLSVESVSPLINASE